MDNIRNTDKTENTQARIKALFKEFSSDELYDAWADTFDIESVSDDKVIVCYHGEESIKLFRKKCKTPLSIAIQAVFGDIKNIKIVKKRKGKRLSTKAKKNINAFKFFVIGMLFVCMATMIIVVMCSYIENRNFRETFYSTSSIKVDSRVRVIQLSDLHGSVYGENNRELLHRIEELKPDIIICTGDMVDSVVSDADFASDLGEKLSGIAPTYYIYGNNEAEGIYDVPLNKEALDEKFGFDESNRDETALLKLSDPFGDRLESVGVRVLKNEKDTINVKGMTIDVYGVLTSNPSAFWPYSGKAFSDYIYENEDNLKITAIHEPILFEEFTSELWGDLIVCGHTHGGIARVPVLGPLYTHEGGIFPGRSGAFVYGRYDASGTPLIVSGGLENSDIFRINNQPELVIIDINKF